VTINRYVPPDIEGLRAVLADQPDDKKVEADEDTGITEKTVAELRARTSWPRGLVLEIVRENYPEAVVKISKVPTSET
jgi:hypothetical protein